MDRKIKILIFGFTFLFQLFTTGLHTKLYSQTQFHYQIRHSPERKEGIIPNTQLVGSGPKIRLIGATIENFELTEPDFKPTKYNLVFYSRDSSKIRVTVQEYKNFYKMQPIEEEYPPGVQTFDWPATIPIDYKIKTSDLFPLAKLRNSQFTTVFPVVLYYSQFEENEGKYRFDFVPQHKILSLNYRITTLHSESFASGGILRELHKKKIFSIYWNGKNENNQVTPDGWFQLSGTASIIISPVLPPREVDINFRFYHHSALLNLLR